MDAIKMWIGIKKWENMIKCALLKLAVFGLFFYKNQNKQVLEKSNYAQSQS